MRRKIIGIFVCMLLILISIIPALKSDYNINDTYLKKNKLSQKLETSEKSLETIEKKQLINKDYNVNLKVNSHNKQLHKILNKIINIEEGKSDLFESNFFKNEKTDINIKEFNILNNYKLYSLNNNYIVKGFILDKSTNQPINDAHIFIVWNGNRDSLDRVYTYSNINGYYSIDLEIGTTHGNIRLIARADGYFDEIMKIQENLENIGEGGELWLNVSLNYGASPENSIICGYVTDRDTNDPIENAEIDFYKYEYDDNYEPVYYYWNYTQTDSSGYFSINIAEGIVSFSTHSDDYYYFINPYFGWVGPLEIKTNEFKTTWTNLSLMSRPPESSIIKGKVINRLTEEPIENIIVFFYWYKHPYFNDFDWAITDSSGNYLLNIPPGFPPYAVCHSENYFYNYGFHYKNIDKSETIRLNIFLDPHPIETSVISGYLTDKITSEPIENGKVYVSWYVEGNVHRYDNSTYTDSSGFYSINVAAGKISVYSWGNNYFGKFIGDYIIGEYETITINSSLDLIPPENSIVCGYITDEITHDPISDVDITLDWRDSSSHSLYYRTTTDSSGFYLVNVPAGEFKIRAYDNHMTHFDYYGSDYYKISDDETLWTDLSLRPHPPENSEVMGIVKHSSNHEPIKYALVVYLCGNQGDGYPNLTIADSKGFYKINIAAGDFELHYFYPGCNHKFLEDNIDNYETYWSNVSLGHYKAQISKPQKGLYLNNIRLLPFLLIPISTPIILGPIDIKIEGTETYFGSGLNIYIDDRLEHEGFLNKKYNWTWDEKTFGKYRLKVIAYTEGFSGINIAGDEITIWNLF